MRSNVIICCLLINLVILFLPSHSQLSIVTRSKWGAKLPTGRIPQINGKAKYVIIHHTHSPKACDTFKKCVQALKSIQNYHMGKKWGDIGYSFLIGNDGRVYEGRGWGAVGAHTLGYNSKGYGISFIGDFTSKSPNRKSLLAAKLLIEEGVKKGYIYSNYNLVGHRDVGSTQCPGNKLHSIIKKWNRYGKR